MESTTEYTYYQFMRNLNLPLFVRIPTTGFDADLPNFLKTMNFSEVSGEDLVEAEKSLNTNIRARLLTIQLASGQVRSQIDQASESDRYGVESITPKPGYRVYRYKKFGLVVFSFNATEWQMGCYENFGTDETVLQSRVVINRFLSWALAPFGVVGFWGVPVEEGMAVLKRDDAYGEAVFFDMEKNRLFTMNGEEEIQGSFQILRLDNVTKRQVRMTREELLSFLNSNTTFMDYEGLTVPIRQAVQQLSKVATGVVHPREEFTPRRDLSL